MKLRWILTGIVGAVIALFGFVMQMKMLLLYIICFGLFIMITIKVVRDYTKSKIEKGLL